jgi:hypothetical protein
MADFWPLALSVDRLHCGGGAAMTAERARCVLYKVEYRYRRLFRHAVVARTLHR